MDQLLKIREALECALLMLETIPEIKEDGGLKEYLGFGLQRTCDLIVQWEIETLTEEE